MTKYNISGFQTIAAVLAVAFLVFSGQGALADGAAALENDKLHGDTSAHAQAHGEATNDDGHMAHMAGALPDGLAIEHPVVLVASAAAKSAAAYMVIENSSIADDRLIAVSADFAHSATLHTTVMENDVAKMRVVEAGFDIPAGGTHQLVRGGDHVMIMGLTTVPSVGQTVNLSLTFEKAGTVTVPFMVMNLAQAGGAQHDHSHE